MADALPALTDAQGRSLRKDVLTQEIGGATMMGVRSIVSGHPAQGLTPQRLARLLRDAEQGDAIAYLELAEEMEEKDLHYLSVLGTRKRQVAQLPITVDAADDSEEAKADAQLVRDWLDRDLLEAELFDILDAIGKGYSATEIVWEFSASAWTPRCLKWRDPRFFEFDRVTGEQLMLRENGPPSELPPAKFLVHFHAAKSGLPIRGGLARIAAWGYMFKNYAIKDWVTFLETYGMPFRLGMHPPGETEGNIRKLMSAVAQLGSDAAAVIPDNAKIEFVDTKRGTAPNDLWRSQAEYIDQQISKAVLGQTNTTDAQAGGFGSGQANVHNDVRGDIERADAKLLAATLNRDLVVPFVMLNRGPRARYPRVKIGHPDKVDVAALIDAATKLVPMGVEVAAEDMREAAGLPAPKPGARLLGQAANPAQEPPEAESGPGVPKRPANDLLDPFKGSYRGDRPAAASAGQREPDAIDDGVDEALGDWEALVTPMVEPIETMLGDFTTLEEAREAIAGAILRMDDREMVDRLANAMFGARLAGDIDLGLERGERPALASGWLSQPRVPRGSRRGGEWTEGRGGPSISMPGSASPRSGTRDAGGGGGDNGPAAAPVGGKPGKLSKEEKAVVGEYSLLAYGKINEHARGEANHGPEVERKIRTMDSAVGKGRLDRDTVLYRGVGGDGLKAMKKGGLAEGSVFTDPGFLSTSRDESVASARFSEDRSAVLIRISAKKGAKALDVSSLSGVSWEKEVVMPRSTKLRVLKWDKRKRIIDVEAIDD